MEEEVWASSSEDEDDGLPRWMEGDSLAPFLGTPGAVLEKALAFAELGEDDTVMDLGCGDGRLVIWAVLQGARRGIGVDIDEALVTKAARNARKRGVAEKVDIFIGDLTAPDARVSNALQAATLITTYLLPEALEVVEPLLVAQLRRPGMRLLTLGWPPPSLTPLKTTTLDLSPGCGMDAFYYSSLT